MGSWLVGRVEIVLPQAPKEESCNAKEMRQFILLLDTIKCIYFGEYL